eukprot:CAMPEP_0194042768 /NCGR_PEP_ID=MMETSP0009_2-20130614/14517_1 /TAXON_ID=210454 /ORGANISM="Grammatophora oceanica, Strain CCMP 410" /LENGTH=821 /DNA_ID=CAMNT_0038686749 /DNA_START=22 /DNA_END=2487 /DNA_ORIENTATION=+
MTASHQRLRRVNVVLVNLFLLTQSPITSILPCCAFVSVARWTNVRPIHQLKTTKLRASVDLSGEDTISSAADSDPDQSDPSSSATRFNLERALFLAGTAFDSYVEPPKESSRWERGSQGLNVAFLSQSFTRNIYKGLVEVKTVRIYDLPDDDDGTESLLTGGGVDACVLVAAVEGSWKEDINLIEKESYHEGVLGLAGSSHIGRSRTAWANVNDNKSKATKRKTGTALPYHIPSTWGKGGQAIMTDDEPAFYLYVQDPSKVRLVFTVLDDDVIGKGDPIGSAHVRLSKLVPMASWTGNRLMDNMKQAALKSLKDGTIDDLRKLTPEQIGLKANWKGEIKLTSKPRIKDKSGQRALGMAAGAMLAGPAGAAAGAVLGSMYEGQVRGRVELQLRYLPILPTETKREIYQVNGGMEGIAWGDLYKKFLDRLGGGSPSESMAHLLEDLEHCFFINHEKTGATCAVYRSIKSKLIVVSFRGTCEPIDLITDASITQDAWVEGEDVAQAGILKVHTGFRTSLQSIARRLKELILAVPGPDEKIEDWDMWVTGHSLGAALATLFTADVAEYGIDAGRSLPQKEASEAWWKSIASSLAGSDALKAAKPPPPPRPRSLCMYNFGSPRVGNAEFANHFQKLVDEGRMQPSYRVVNGQDVIARVPRSMNALAFGNVFYDHCGPTVLVSLDATDSKNASNVIWIEGESDDEACPVRDGTPLTSPLADGSLLSDLSVAAKATFEGEESIGSLAAKFSDRLKTLSATDITSVVGIDRAFAEREGKLIQSILNGEALAHHMEDEYYAAIGRASGFRTRVGEKIVRLVDKIMDETTT